MKCNNCNSENPDYAKFCGNCGTELLSVPPPANQPYIPPPPVYNYQPPVVNQPVYQQNQSYPAPPYNASSMSAGSENFKFNTGIAGKILFTIMIILFFLPWLNISDGLGLLGKSGITFTPYQFAFNILPDEMNVLGFKVSDIKKIDYDEGPYPVHTVFLSMAILLVIGFGLNFINFKISNKFNVVNIVSIIIFTLVLGYLYMTADKYRSVSSSTIWYYIFAIINIISIFEGIIEFELKKRLKIG
jgi:hypothetical protein